MYGMKKLLSLFVILCIIFLSSCKNLDINKMNTEINIDKIYLQNVNDALPEIIKFQKKYPYIHFFMAVGADTDIVMNVTAHVLQKDFNLISGKTDEEKIKNFINLFCDCSYNSEEIPDDRFDGVDIYLNNSSWRAAVSTAATIDTTRNSDPDKNADLLFRIIPEDNIYCTKLYTLKIDAKI